MDRRHTAIHEAGHAVVGRVLGLACGDVTIVPDYEDGAAGSAIVADPWLILSRWQEQGKFREIESVFRGRILAMMAGAEAEEEILGRCAGGDGEDRRQIGYMLEEVPGDPEKVEPRLRRAARHLVRRHREAVERVAAALAEHETLTGAEVDGLVPVYQPRRELPFWAARADAA